MIKKEIERLGETNISNEGCKMKIIKYKNANNILIEFQDKYKAIVHAAYRDFKKGKVKNPYYKSIFDVGYFGQGKYKTSSNGKHTKAYKIWFSMLRRCYDPYFINRDKSLSYKDVFVCEEWHNFQNFAKWFYKNYYEVEGEIMHLDKDILCKGNKIYSPETCVFVPQRINSLFVKQQRKRGEYPIGVSPNKRDNCLQVNCNTLEKQEFLGHFSLNKPFQAFTAYKNFKENYIKQIADKYKDLIPKELYNALYKYEVEIND